MLIIIGYWGGSHTIFICFSSESLQAQLVSLGVIPTLVKLLSVQSHNAAVTEMCLAAFTSLAELGELRVTATVQGDEMLIRPINSTCCCRRESIPTSSVLKNKMLLPVCC